MGIQMNKTTFTLLSLLLISATLSAGACPKEKCGKCVTDDTKSKMWCTECFMSKVTGTGTDTTCEGNDTGIPGCAAVELDGTAQKCISCDNKGGNFRRDANKTDCSVKCVKETHYFEEASFTCKARVDSKDNCQMYSDKSDECQMCKAGYSIVSKKCESMTAIPNCATLDGADKTKCAECKPGYWLKDATTCTACVKGYALKADATCIELKGCDSEDFTAASGFCKRCNVPDAFATAADTTPAKVGTDYRQVCTPSAKGPGSSGKIIGSIISMIALISLAL